MFLSLLFLFIGMIAGYILYRVKVPPKVPFVINVMLWSISLFILFIVIFGVRGGELNLIVTSLYVSLGHTGNHTHSIISSPLLCTCAEENSFYFPSHSVLTFLIITQKHIQIHRTFCHGKCKDILCDDCTWHIVLADQKSFNLAKGKFHLQKCTWHAF